MPGVQPTFLYPYVNQFPFDELCGTIVRELEKRNWDVPGINVEFDTYGTGENKYRMVSHVTGDDFKLWFCRIQRPIAGTSWNDVAAVHELFIPGKELHVYASEDGPTLKVYVGNDWEADKKWFFKSSKVNTRMNKEPRRHLEYRGSISFNDYSYYKGRRSPYLLTTDDLGRQYSPVGDEPTYYETDAVMEEFRAWIEKNVLHVILSHPESPASNVAPPELTPFPADKIGPFFTYIERQDVNRIKIGQNNPKELPPGERYGLPGGGWRLVSLGVNNDGTIPEIAYDGFIWCQPGEITAETTFDELPVRLGNRYSSDAVYLAKIKPQFAEGIYVADREPQTRYKREIFEQNLDQNELTDEQFDEYLRASGRTIVPIIEYQGNYADPVILINRELGFDEIELIS